MTARLTSDMWVSAYLARLRLAAIPAYVAARGDATAGSILVKLALLDGTARIYQRRFDLMADRRAWILMHEGPETEVDDLIRRERNRDPDIWIIEIEDRSGRTLLDEPGLDE